MTETKKNKRWKLVLNIATVIALAVLCYLIRDEIVQTVENVQRVNIYALLLIIPLQALNYNAYARMYVRLFGLLGNKISRKDMLKVTLELNLVNNVFPSGGVSGFSYFGVRLKRLGVSTGKATLVQTMKFVLLFVSFEILLAFGLLFLALGGQASNMTILVASSLATFLFMATAGAAFLIGSEKRINSFFTYVTQQINRLIHLARRKHPETISVDRVQKTFKELHENYVILKSDYRKLVAPALFALLANVSEVLTLYVVYIAFDQWVNPGAIILAYAIANFAGLISVLPGGIGIYEAIMTAVLVTAGIPASVSIPVTIMYRVLNTTVQLVPGYYFYHKALREDPVIETLHE
ncbi:MAG: lysylphosphatidylglycerol synthase transmembrane domain-containing protein [Candidatus Saccharimonadales bacterium]